jgi:transketolase
MALAANRDELPWRVFAILSDGECDEGSTWEAVLFAAHHRLDNLVAVIDYNHLQSLDSVERTLALEPLAEKFKAFGWGTVEVDGHDIHGLREVLGGAPHEHGKPTAVIAHTIKGKGVSFMEGEVLWHYRPPTDDELARALEELSGEDGPAEDFRSRLTMVRTAP